MGPEGSVLDAGQDPIPRELVERHTPLAGSTLDHGARAEHGIGLFGQERTQNIGKRLWRVLAVAVEHDHNVEPMFDGQVVPGLLIPPVTQVHRLPDKSDRQIRLLLVAQTHQIGRVLAVIVADDYLFDFGPELGRDAVEHFGQGRRRVVRHDENSNSLLFDGSTHRYLTSRPQIPLLRPSVRSIPRAPGERNMGVAGAIQRDSAREVPTPVAAQRPLRPRRPSAHRRREGRW